MFRVLKSSHAPSHPPTTLWGGPSVQQGEVGGWVWEVMAVGGLWMQGEVAELPGNNPCIANRMIRNVQLFVGHSDLPGQVTHVLLPAIQARGNWIADALLRLFLGSRQNSIPAHLILCHTYVQFLFLSLLGMEYITHLLEPLPCFNIAPRLLLKFVFVVCEALHHLAPVYLSRLKYCTSARWAL